MTTEIKITGLEKQFLTGMVNSYYGEAPDHETWTFGAVEQTTLTQRQAGGIISSLLKKGVIHQYDAEGKGCYDDSVVYLTDLGIEIMGTDA